MVVIKKILKDNYLVNGKKVKFINNKMQFPNELTFQELKFFCDYLKSSNTK